MVYCPIQDVCVVLYIHTFVEENLSELVKQIKWHSQTEIEKQQPLPDRLMQPLPRPYKDTYGLFGVMSYI